MTILPKYILLKQCIDSKKEINRYRQLYEKLEDAYMNEDSFKRNQIYYLNMIEIHKKKLMEIQNLLILRN